jgi:conserved oligomeric Golgi complex subunit 8
VSFRRSCVGFGFSSRSVLSSHRQRLRSRICRVFEVATQFNAIFRAQSPSESSVPSLSLLGMWLGRRIHAFLNLLATQLHGMEDSAALRDALEASVFFATSMGRLGADFTPRLGPIFEPRMLAIVARQWKDGSALLAETFATCRNAQVNFPLVAVVSSGSAPEGGGGTAAAPACASTHNDGGVMPPPRLLLSLPPLARFVNAILSGLNELRRCLLPGIFSRLILELEQVLAATRLELVAHERAVLVPGFRGEAAALRETAARYLQLWDELVSPYTHGSLRAALGQMDQAESFYQSLREKAPEPSPSDDGAATAPLPSDPDAPMADELIVEETSEPTDSEGLVEDE